MAKVIKIFAILGEKDPLSCMVNTMFDDDLGMEGARASAASVLT